jgi:V8-like Glu-specific endopeptidase
MSILIPLFNSGFALAQLTADCPVDACDYKIIGDNDLEPIKDAAGTPEYDFAQGVARMEQQIDDYGYCTAARIGESLFITNFHCARPCETVQFTMGYASDKEESQRLTLKCEKLLYKNPTLDYSLFLVAPLSEAESLTAFPVLAVWSGALQEGQRVSLPSYPAGRMLEIDHSPACVLGSVEVFHTQSGRDTIKHMCDSETGSSGAPLLDFATGAVVGLHWGGIDGEYNMAIPMPLILEDIKANVAPEFLEQLKVHHSGAEAGQNCSR